MFIVVCNDTVNSRTVAEYIAGFERVTPDGEVYPHQGRLALFRNYDDDLNPLPRPRTLLIDSQRIDSGEAIDTKFRDAYADEIDAFRREKAARIGQAADTISDEEILREVLNTVGKAGRLGADVRCVVSVSMLTEGWDANTVTHILGLRAFSTKLISEQVVGRALRRLSYDVSVDPVDGVEKFPVEYADIIGIDDLNFSAQPRIAPPAAPREVVHVSAVSPERDHLEIVFPRVEGYRTVLPDKRLTADFSRLEPYVIDPDKVSATEVTMAGIVGQLEKLTLAHLGNMLPSEIVSTKSNLFEPDPRFSHVNWIVLDSEWGAKLAQILEANPQVIAYAKNHNFGLRCRTCWKASRRWAQLGAGGEGFAATTCR